MTTATTPTRTSKQDAVRSFIIAQGVGYRVNKHDIVLALGVGLTAVYAAVRGLREDGLMTDGVLTGRRWIKQVEVAALAAELGEWIGIDREALLTALCERYLCPRETAYDALEYAIDSRAITNCGNDGYGMIRVAA
jgi:hypothetical protein